MGEQWTESRIDELGDGRRPVLKAGPFGSSVTKATYQASGYKVYGQQEVVAKDLKAEAYFVSEATFRRHKGCEVKPGDLLMTMMGTIGRVYRVPEGAPEGIINPRLVRIALDSSRILPEFAEAALEQPSIQRLLNRRSHGGTMQGLNLDALASIQLKIPPIPEQRKIAAILCAWDKALEKLTELRVHRCDRLAVRFKEVLDEIGHVSSAIIISAPDDREGNEEVDQDSKDIVRAFWAKMMAQYKSEEEYNRSVIDAFKGSEDPEILIVVSKLLTGFDAPRNTVLYVCKPLKEHNLLQAIARVNRLHEEDEVEKQFGFIVDYEGLLGELDEALSSYSAFDGYDAADLSGSVHDVREEIRRLPQLHDQLLDLFNPVRNKKDMEALEQFLGDEAVRGDFYGRFRDFSRCLHISLSSDKFLDVFDERKIEQMKRDWKQFSELKRSVQLRYQETVDVREFEPKIQKLLDDHVVALPAETVIELVNINDPAALKAVVEEAGLSDASKADRIASATRRVITEKMDEDPSFYRQFSEMLEDTIRAYRERRLSERAYLNSVIDLASKIARKERDRESPAMIRADDDAQALFGLLDGQLTCQGGDMIGPNEAAIIALAVTDIIRANLIVGIWSNEVAQNKLRNAIDDYFFDVLRDTMQIELPLEQLDDLEQRIMDLAKARFTT